MKKIELPVLFCIAMLNTHTLPVLTTVVDVFWCGWRFVVAHMQTNTHTHTRAREGARTLICSQTRHFGNLPIDTHIPFDGKLECYLGSEAEN